MAKKTIRNLEQKFASKLNQQTGSESDRFLKQSMRTAESQMRKLRLEYDEKLVNFNKEKNNLIHRPNRKSDKEAEMHKSIRAKACKSSRYNQQ